MDYNYLDNMIEDVKTAITERHAAHQVKEALRNREDFGEELREELWTDDAVTGNPLGTRSEAARNIATLLFGVFC